MSLKRGLTPFTLAKMRRGEYNITKNIAEAYMAKKKKAVKKRVASKGRVKKVSGGKKKAVVKPSRKPAGIEGAMEKVGVVSHYFPKVKAAAVKLKKGGLRVGDEIYIKGHTTDFKEKVKSIQLDHTTIAEGKKGQEIGLLVKSRVRIGDSIYKI